MRLYNSLTNKLEDFNTIEEKTLKMYVCGPTVYNFIHIGNARPVIFFDVVKRYFEFLGYKVIYASNITDIDDKIVNKAIENGVTEKDIATQFENAYFEDCKRLHSSKPDLVPHATEYLDDMADYIDELIQKGFAYKVDDDIYFRVNKVSEYGILSNQTLDDLKDNVRITNTTNKENIKDFTLWKKPEKGILFDTKIGLGRPGWHTECVCMNESLFKGKIDIHGGGSDLKFPHHENEIAQSLALHNHTIANFFMHVGRLNFNGVKMSKSLGNSILVRDILETYDANSFRLLILSTPYRQNINFTNELMEQFEKEYQKIYKAYKQADLALQINDINNNCLFEEYITQMNEFMNNDLNTGNVITLAYDLVKKINTYTRSKEYDLLSKSVNTLKVILNVLGIEIELKQLETSDKEIYANWENARKEKNFDLADKYRQELIQRGIL